MGLTGMETFTIELEGDFKVNQAAKVHASTGTTFACHTRLDTEPEIAYFKNGGILQYVLRKLVA